MDDQTKETDVPSPRRIRKSPASMPETLKVIRLETPREEKKQMGRPKKLVMPPLPEELFNGMSDLERQHFEFFIRAFTEKYNISSPTDLISLHLAAFDYIQTLRVQALQMKTGETITMARQHPAVQLRAWLDQLDVTRKGNKNKTEKNEEAEEMKSFLFGSPSKKSS